MIEIPFFQVDAFSGNVFSGNPAGVCLLEKWHSDAVLQSIAAENNLSETAFLVRREEFYELRWFTPEIEVDLCGHATLASGHVLFKYFQPHTNRAEFLTKSGKLAVEQSADLLFLDFPSRKPTKCQPPARLEEILGASPADVLCSRDLMVVFDEESTIKELQPDLAAMAKLKYFALVVTAPGERSDFVSRFFAPRAGIPEDPVTGSAHCTLIPYWSERLGKKNLHAFQLSKRGGELFCVHRDDRVLIGGRAVTYLKGTIELENVEPGVVADLSRLQEPYRAKS
jgi:PhzF family phenazine biosynthesis protein